MYRYFDIFDNTTPKKQKWEKLNKSRHFIPADCLMSEKSKHNPLTETDVSFLYLRNSNPWHMYTHHRDEKEGILAQGKTQGRYNKHKKKGKQEGYNRALQALAVLWAGGGEGRNAADWPSWHWGKRLEDERCTVQLFITSVCGGGGTEELQEHALSAKSRPRKSVTEGFRHASVEWKVNTPIRRRRLGGRACCH